MPIIDSEFKPIWWLKNPHLQTIWPTFFKKRPELELEKERLELTDGDFLDISSTMDSHLKPLVLLVHGLEGTLESHYAKPLMKLLNENDFAVSFMHFRGCSGEANRLQRSYHSGDSADLQAVTEHLQNKHQRPLFCIIGFSLGGNVLLKWLGEKQLLAETTTAIAVSVPFRLRDAADRLEKSFSKVYQKHLITSCQIKYKTKNAKMNLNLVDDVKKISTFHEFDDKITAPLHGFKNADDYYQKCSSRQFLKTIRKPTLIIHAKDDPFMWNDSAPQEQELSSEVQLELTNQGGHVGFVTGKYPWKTEYWLDQRILQWLNQQRQKILN